MGKNGLYISVAMAPTERNDEFMVMFMVGEGPKDTSPHIVFSFPIRGIPDEARKDRIAQAALELFKTAVDAEDHGFTIAVVSGMPVVGSTS